MILISNQKLILLDHLTLLVGIHLSEAQKVVIITIQLLISRWGDGQRFSLMRTQLIIIQALTTSTVPLKKGDTTIQAMGLGILII